MKRVVRKALLADGVLLSPGDVVDVAGWRNLAALERMRYVAPVEETDATPVDPEAALAVLQSAALEAPAVPVAPTLTVVPDAPEIGEQAQKRAPRARKA